MSPPKRTPVEDNNESVYRKSKRFKQGESNERNKIKINEIVEGMAMSK